MNINKFRIDGGSVVVEYTEGPDLYKIETGDDPRAELLAAAVATVAQAQAYLGTSFDATFREINLSHGADPASRLTLSMRCNDKFDTVRIGLPRIKAVLVTHDGEVAPDNLRNWYNGTMWDFLEEIKAYVQGKRQQMALPFEPEYSHA